jgi:hypothetical protein
MRDFNLDAFFRGFQALGPPSECQFSVEELLRPGYDERPRILRAIHFLMRVSGPAERSPPPPMRSFNSDVLNLADQHGGSPTSAAAGAGTPLSHRTSTPKYGQAYHVSSPPEASGPLLPRGYGSTPPPGSSGGGQDHSRAAATNKSMQAAAGVTRLMQQCTAMLRDRMYDARSPPQMQLTAGPAAGANRYLATVASPEVPGASLDNLGPVLENVLGSLTQVGPCSLQPPPPAAALAAAAAWLPVCLLPSLAPPPAIARPLTACRRAPLPRPPSHPLPGVREAAAGQGPRAVQRQGPHPHPGAQPGDARGRAAARAAGVGHARGGAAAAAGAGERCAPPRALLLRRCNAVPGLRRWPPACPAGVTPRPAGAGRRAQPAAAAGGAAAAAARRAAGAWALLLPPRLLLLWRPGWALQRHFCRAVLAAGTLPQRQHYLFSAPPLRSSGSAPRTTPALSPPHPLPLRALPPPPRRTV